jgi:DNA-binding protein WhiA
MSFSAETKNELARLLPARRCCKLAELSALMHIEGTLHILGANRIAFHTESESAAVARKMFQLSKELFSLSPEIRVHKVPRLSGHNCYYLYLGEDERTAQVLNELGLIDNSMRPVLGVPARIVRRYCCGISYLRGAFLGGGYVSRPDQPVHLEINVQHPEMAGGLCDLLARYSLNAQVSTHKRLYAVYSKSRDDRVGFLALLGAYNSVLRLENDAVLREIKEKINRKVNSETANLERTVNAAQNQLKDIRYIEMTVGLEGLPCSLREVADVRLRHPEASLKELGSYLQPPISKSAVYHRLLRIREFVSKIG